MSDRALTERQEAAWRAFALTMQLLDGVLDKQLQRDAGMPHTYFGILAALSEQPDRTFRMGELAGCMSFSQSRLSHAVARMEAAGWVTRRPAPDDRRATLATLTDQGYAAFTAAAPGHVGCVQHHVFDALTEEQVERLREICEAILNRLHEESESTSE